MSRQFASVNLRPSAQPDEKVSAHYFNTPKTIYVVVDRQTKHVKGIEIDGKLDTTLIDDSKNPYTIIRFFMMHRGIRKGEFTGYDVPTDEEGLAFFAKGKRSKKQRKSVRKLRRKTASRKTASRRK